MRRLFLFVLGLLLAVPPVNAQDDTLTISGTFTATDGTPLTPVFVLVLEANGFAMVTAPSLTDANGYYEFEVPANNTYLLLAVPLSGRQLDGFDLHGHTPALGYVDDADPVADFTGTACHDFIWLGYDADGEAIGEDDWGPQKFATRLDDNVTNDLLLGIDRETDGLGGLFDCVPLGSTRRFFVQWTVPDYGRVMLPMDNGGVGFTATEVGGTLLNANYELARTQVRRLEEALAASQDYTIPPSVTGRLEAAQDALEAATQASEEATRAAHADRAISAALWGLETLVLARAEADIPRYRQGDLTVKVLDADGNPVPDATLDYQQETHDFLFGIFDTYYGVGRDGYELMREAGLNAATVGVYWTESEPHDGAVGYHHLDNIVGIPHLDAMGFTLSAHPLVWFIDLAVPDYLAAMTTAQAEAEVVEHATALVSHYHEEIDNWNTINEAHGRFAAADYDRAQITVFTELAGQVVRQHDPDAPIIINSGFDWYAQNRLGRYFESGQADDFTLSIMDYLRQLEADGVDYDIIGQQMYNGGYVGILEAWGVGDPVGVTTWDMGALSYFIDQLHTFGKPIHITEMAVPSTWDDDWEQYGAGWWHRPWDANTQAEYVRAFYTLAFSKPAVAAITWWDIDDRESFIWTGGLLDADDQPKPAYYALRDLIASWTSAGQVSTNAQGQVTLRGFGGDYTLTVDGQTFEAHITEQTTTAITLTLQ